MKRTSRSDRYIVQTKEHYTASEPGGSSKSRSTADDVLRHRRAIRGQTFETMFLSGFVYVALAYNSAIQQVAARRTAGLGWWASRAAWLPRIDPASGYALLAVIAALSIAMAVGLPRTRTLNESNRLAYEESNELLRFGPKVLAILAATVCWSVVADAMSAHLVTTVPRSGHRSSLVMNAQGTVFAVATVTSLLAVVFAYAAAIMAQPRRDTSDLLKRAYAELDLNTMDYLDRELRRLTGQKIRHLDALRRPRRVLFLPSVLTVSAVTVAISCLVIGIGYPQIGFASLASCALLIAVITVLLLRVGAVVVGNMRNRPRDFFGAIMWTLISIIFMTTPFITRAKAAGGPHPRVDSPTRVGPVAIFTVPFSVVNLALVFTLLITAERWVQPQGKVGRWFKSHLRFLMRENRHAYLAAYGLVKAVGKTRGVDDLGYIHEIDRTWIMPPTNATRSREAHANYRLRLASDAANTSGLATCVSPNG